MSCPSDEERGMGLDKEGRQHLWPQLATPTKLMINMVFAWSVASHLACDAPHEGALADAGVPPRDVKGEELEDMLPMEPLWDILLPLSGVSIDVLGLQLTLGLSLAEPLLLLLLPWLGSMLRAFDGRLLSWHLGSIFAHPMLVAQVVVAKAEKRQGLDAGVVVGFGALVLAYALGAVFGSRVRILIHEHTWPGMQRYTVDAAAVLAIVSMMLVAVARQGSMLRESGETHPSEESPLNRGGSTTVSTTSASSNWRIRLHHAAAEAAGAFHVAWNCRHALLSRAFTLLALSLVIGTAPVASVNVLGSGLNVMWFDIANIIASSVLGPLSVVRFYGCNGVGYLEGAFCVAAGACLLAAVSSARAENRSQSPHLYRHGAFNLVVVAGVALSVSAGLVNTLLSMHMLKRVKDREAAVALGWGLLAGGLAQHNGTRLGSTLFLQFSWLGVVGAAGLASCLAWWQARQAVLAGES